MTDRYDEETLSRLFPRIWDIWIEHVMKCLEEEDARIVPPEKAGGIALRVMPHDDLLEELDSCLHMMVLDGERIAAGLGTKRMSPGAICAAFRSLNIVRIIVRILRETPTS
jgi:hypothetical protein